MIFAYKNITISGGVGVGSTTLLNNLKPHLQQHGFDFQSTGALMREKMNETKQPLAELVADDVHKTVENHVKELLESGEQWVIEGWLAGFIARDIDHTLRVFVYTSDQAVRVDRISNRENVSVEEAKHMIEEREKKNFALWQDIYGDYDFWDPKYYQLTIDTYTNGQEETVEKVLNALENK